MNVPFYAETSSFQLWTAIAYLTAAALFFSLEKIRWEYFAAGGVCLYIAFDERFMFHECIRLTFPTAKKMANGDMTILVLSLMGIGAAAWGIWQLSSGWVDRLLYFFAGVICVQEIYLDVLEKHIFYLELDVKIEEISELVLALLLIFIAIKAGVKKRALAILPLLLMIFFVFENHIHTFVWATCPKLKVFK